MSKEQLAVKEAAARYSVSVANTQGVPPGYKQTEVGVIPEDWNVAKLRECLVRSPEYGINAPAVPYSDNLPTYIRITDISEDGRFAPESLVSVENENAGNYFLEDGDLVFARTGASVGKSYLYNKKDGALVFAGFLIRVKPDKNKLIPAYLANYVTTPRYWNWVRLMSMRSGQPGINGNEYAQLPVPLPPLPEQRAIAATLSDVDALIAALDKLIAKKRAIKTAAMQQLLTGKQRLPGFSGEWVIHQLSSIGAFRGGNGFPTKYQGLIDGDYPFYKVSDMNNEGNSTFMINSNNWISETIRKAIGATVFPKHSIVFAKIGAAIFLERKKILSQASCIDNNMMGFIVDEDCADYRFVHYVFLNIQLGKLVSTTALPSLNGKEIGTLEFAFPKVEEQQAIATVLSDMDAEITALEARRDKTKAIKQGMMQELLTGRTRLV